MWPQGHSSWVSGIRGGGKDHCFTSAGGPRPAVETARPEATRRMGWPVTRARQAHPGLGFLVRKGRGGHKVSRDPPATHSSAHPGLVSGSLGPLSLALLVPTLRSREDAGGSLRCQAEWVSDSGCRTALWQIMCLSCPPPGPAAHPSWLTLGVKRNSFGERLSWEQPESNLCLQSRPQPILPLQDSLRRWRLRSCGSDPHLGHLRQNSPAKRSLWGVPMPNLAQNGSGTSLLKLFRDARKSFCDFIITRCY